MSEKLKIYNFDFGTVQVETDDVKIKISKEQFEAQNQDNVTKTELITDTDSNFLSRNKIIEDDDNYIFIYNKSLKSSKSLVEIKSETYPVKASIAETILEQDILNEYINDDIYISLNPATIFYYPMETVKYTYAGNSLMPRTQQTALARYKACVASIFSGIPYEKCLNSPEEVKNEGNDLIKEIYEKNSRIELLQFVSDSNNFITYDYIENRTKDKKKSKNRFYITVGSLVILGIAGIILTSMVSSNNQLEMAQTYEAEIEQKDTQIEAEQAMQTGEYEQAIQLFEEAGIEASIVADKLLANNQYQLAINVDNSKLEQVIQTLYENGEQSMIADFNADNLNEEATGKLEDEQAIVSGDSNTMTNVLNFLNDENTAVRLANRFAEMDDLNSVEQIQSKYPENKTINQLVENGIQVRDLQSQIDDLNQQLDDTDDEDEKNNIQSQIDDKQEQLDNLNAE